MMTLMMISSTVLVYFKSPMKTSLMITVVSLAVASYSYSTSSSILPSCATILTFSSGMMILFCYCSMMTSYKETTKKPKMKTTATVLALTSVIMAVSSQWNTPTNMKMSSHPKEASMMILAMMVVVITMMCINKSMFSTSKPLMLGY